jgi:O-methyltransferase
VAPFPSGPAVSEAADTSRAPRPDSVSFPLPPEGADPAALYLDLVKRCLLNWPYADVELGSRTPPGTDRARLAGRDWPPTAHTMLGLARLDNVQFAVETVLREGVPGDLLEAGVWRGGAAILMRAVLRVRGATDRTVWLADSFRGLPAPDPGRYPHDAGLELHQFPQLAVSLDRVRRNFARYGLLDERVRFLEGWFKDTLPAAPVEHLAVLRADGDLYESTTDVLTALYPRVSPGGFVIIDDYFNIPACRHAVDDYRREHGITASIVTVDWSAVYWRV